MRLSSVHARRVPSAAPFRILLPLVLLAACAPGELKEGLAPNDAEVVAVVVTPEKTAVVVAETTAVRASAVGLDGQPAPAEVDWTASGGTIVALNDSTARFSAGSAGTYRVRGRHRRTPNPIDSATIVVATPPPVLQAVVLTPATASVAAGAQQNFTVSGQWSDGSTTAPAVTYSATGGTVNTNGRYTAGTTAGTFRVIAVQQGGTLADTSTVTVTASPSGVLFSDDFESGLGQWEDVTQVHIGTAQAHSGTKSLELSYAAGSDDAGWAWRKRLVPDQAAPHDQYVRWWQRWSAGFTFYNGNGSDQKLMMLEGLSPQSGWAQTANWKIYLHVVGRSVSSISGTTLYPERFIWDGTSQWSGQWQGYLPTTQIPYAADRWICTEVQVKHNTPGQPDGELRVWIDGALMTQRTGVKFRDAAVSWNAIEISGYYDGGSPKAQTSWVDDVVVSTQRIGC